ncbi:MAG: hypothetical protein L0Z53_14075 [Acidobacteriales bacterium]|nr:hypothetical protein [Terriglobales bacterium]
MSQSPARMQMTQISQTRSSGKALTGESVGAAERLCAIPPMRQARLAVAPVMPGWDFGNG